MKTCRLPVRTFRIIRLGKARLPGCIKHGESAILRGSVGFGIQTKSEEKRREIWGKMNCGANFAGEAGSFEKLDVLVMVKWNRE